ncbi:MAG: chemotaxis protein CheW [Planctomycetota bacterium]
MSESQEDFQDLISDFVAESREHMSTVESDLLRLEEGDGDADTVNNVFRCVHSVKGVAGFLGLETIQRLSHAIESTLDLVRKDKLQPVPELISCLLSSIDGLKELVEEPTESNQADIEGHMVQLQVFLDQSELAATAPPPAEAAAAVSDADAPAAEAADATASPEAAASPPSNAEPAAEQPTPAVSAPAAPASASPPAKKKAAGAAAGKAETDKPKATRQADSIRVSVDLLNRLMTLSGEMVLGRNQVLQSVPTSGERGLGIAVANLSQVVSEMQEAIMQTRLQPVATIFQKFPRVVRDLTSKLGKECRLNITGKEVELDRSILEVLGDPLTHLVRNALDHGIETPAIRRKAGKPTEGTIDLRAFHQGGNVKIDISDDGAGIDPSKLRARAVEKGVISQEAADTMGDRDARMLIFAPGFSTAAELSDISGRGVGMDVVRSNIEKIGGNVDVRSESGAGTTLIITIPLTLAIMPALVVTCAGRRYVMPQSNVTELVRIRTADAEQRLVKIKDRDVLRLRGRLLPVLHLREALGLTEKDEEERRNFNIMVVQSGALEYGLVIDEPPDTEEIVVKPLGKHIRGRQEFSGSTILGDGQVALILDVAGLASSSDLRSVEPVGEESHGRDARDGLESECSDFVIFRSNPEELFAVPLGLVSRIQRVEREQTLRIGGRLVHQTETDVLPIVELDQHIVAEPIPDTGETASLLVLRVKEHEFAVLTSSIEEIHRTAVQLDDQTLAGDGIIGSFQMHEDTVRLVDSTELARKALPQLLVHDDEPTAKPAESSRPGRVLLAEDSSFFRKHVQRIIGDGGFEVVACEDGDVAWEALNKPGAEFDLIVTDIQMPNCDGLELTRRIRAKAETRDIPVLALTSLSTSDAVAEGRAAGVTEYLVKLDDAALLAAIRRTYGALA